MKHKISTIICHHQGELVYRCLKSLEKVDAEKIVITSSQEFKPWQDDGIHPHKDYICGKTLYVIKNEPAFKRNFGAKEPRGKYLVFMDDDVEVKYDCIQRMSDYLDSHADVGMVYAMLYKMDTHAVIDTSGSFFTWCGFLHETYIDRINPVPVLSGKSALCMVRKDVFDAVGGFDEDFVIYGEETDLSWRIWLAGYKIMVLPSAIGYHAFETALKPRSYYNQKYIHYHGCKNYLSMLIKNLPANKLYIVAINALIWLFMACCLVFRNRQGAVWILQGMWYNVANFGYVWRKRLTIKRIDNNFLPLVTKNPSILYYLSRFKDYLVHQLHG